MKTKLFTLLAIHVVLKKEIEWNQGGGFTIKNKCRKRFSIQAGPKLLGKLVRDCVYGQLHGSYVVFIGLDFF